LSAITDPVAIYGAWFLWEERLGRTVEELPLDPASLLVVIAQMKAMGWTQVPSLIA
jgi:hypothetical protein